MGAVRLEDSDLAAMTQARAFAAGYRRGPEWLDGPAETAMVVDSAPVEPIPAHIEGLLAAAALARLRRLPGPSRGPEPHRPN